MGFLYKKLSGKEKKEIKKEADLIIEKFSKNLEVLKGLPDESGVRRQETMRLSHKEGKKGDVEFKKRIFANTPNKNKYFIIAEKKSWK